MCVGIHNVDPKQIISQMFLQQMGLFGDNKELHLEHVTMVGHVQVH